MLHSPARCDTAALLNWIDIPVICREMMRAYPQCKKCDASCCQTVTFQSSRQDFHTERQERSQPAWSRWRLQRCG